MRIKDKWVAFYSQTGGEIKDLIVLGHVPDVVVTDNFTSYVQNYEFFETYNIQQEICALNVSKSDKINMYNKLLKNSWLVTLHGWLNIVPGEICEKYNIYNGHPGLITEYPELKGKDPQARVFKNPKKYPTIGAVIHRVTEVVDGGEVVAEAQCKRQKDIASLDAIIEVLKFVSLRAWAGFFENIDIIIEDELNLDGTLKNNRDVLLPVVT